MKTRAMSAHSTRANRRNGDDRHAGQSPDRRIRVLHCIHGFGPGGAQRFVQTLMRYQQRRTDCEPVLCVFSNRPDQPGGHLDGIGRTAFLQYSNRLTDPGGTSRFVRRFRALCRAFNPDIIHSHLWPGCRLSALAATALPVHHLWHIHDTRPWLTDTTLRCRALRTVTRLAGNLSGPKLVAVSHAAARYTAEHLGLRTDRVRVVPNGVDIPSIAGKFGPEEFRPAGGELTIGAASLFRPEKGHRLLLAAFAELVERGFPLTLRLAGSGPTQKACEDQVCELGLESRVRFEGLLQTISGLLQTLDIFVLPSTG